jgi:uncharacterized membrane protein
MRAGIPLSQAMTGLARSTRNETLREVLFLIKATVESGRELSVALAQHPKIFSSLYVNTVRIGESTGRLDDAFQRLAEYLERDRDTRSRIQTALRYPSFVVLAIGIAIGIINVVVIPQFAAIFERAHAALPLPTRILMATSGFFVAWWPALLMASVGAAVAFRAWRRTELGAYRWDRFKLRIPIIGDIINRATLGRFARGFSMSLAAGVPLTQALSIMAQAVDNEYLGERIRNIRNGVERGESLTRTATATGTILNDDIVPGVLSIAPLSSTKSEGNTGSTAFTFTVGRGDYQRAMDILTSQVKGHVQAEQVLGDPKVSKVSVVGVGMRSHVGIASTMFRTLSEEGINIQMISTSEIKISVLIDEKYMELAVRALHKAFELDQA